MYFIGDELLSDSFPYKEIENGALWEVEGKVRIFTFYADVLSSFICLVSVQYCLISDGSCQIFSYSG